MPLPVISAYYAQVLGLYLVFICFAMLMQPNMIKKVVTELVDHPTSLFICSMIKVVFGLIILVPHNVWAMNWAVVVTLVGWFILIKGLLGLYFPEKSAHFIKKLLNHTNAFQIWAIVWFLIGLYLVWVGFTQGV